MADLNTDVARMQSDLDAQKTTNDKILSVLKTDADAIAGLKAQVAAGNPDYSSLEGLLSTFEANNHAMQTALGADPLAPAVGS